MKKEIFDIRREWLDTKAAANYLGVTAANLRVKIHRGQIRADGRLGSRPMFRRESLDKQLESALQRRTS